MASLRPRAVGAGLLLAATPLALAAPSQADPGGDTFQLSCDGGSTYTVVTAGDGNFTPAHDADSNTMFIPTSFGEFHGVVTNAETGELVDEFTDPPGMKGSSGRQQRATMTTCTFVFSGDEFVPELGFTIHFEGSGSVTGFSTPAR
jgi:hypothetical protein